MPRPQDRTTTRRKIFRKTPKGTVKKIIKMKITTRSFCGLCKKLLQGTTTKRNKSKTQKMPTRMFGGHLCHNCTQELIKLKTRINDNDIKLEDTEIRLHKYLKAMK